MRVFLTAGLALLVGMIAGCSQPAASGSKNVASGANVSDNRGSTQTPVSSPESGAASAEKLIGALPQDKLPKPGADGSEARDVANTWLEQNIQGRMLEASFKVTDLQIGAGDQNDTLSFTPRASRPDGVQEQLSGGISIGTTTIGNCPCTISLCGPEPTWKNVPRDQSEKYEALKDKRINYRGKIVYAKFLEGDTAQKLLLVFELEALQPDFPKVEVARNTQPSQGDSTSEKSGQSAEDAGQLAAVEKVRKQMPKPLAASELPAQPAIASGIDRLLPPDDFFPIRREVGPVVEGKRHGEIRAYAPNRQLIYVQLFKNDKPQGLQRTFYPSGKPFGIMNIVQDKPDGTVFNFFESGQVRSISTWKDGILEGPNVLYFDDGKIASIYENKKGKREGISYHYLPSGPLFGKQRWENGKEMELVDLGGVNSNPFSVDSVGNIERQLNSRSYILKDYWGKNSTQTRPVKTEHKVGEWISLFNGKNLGNWWPQLDPQLKNPLDQLVAWEVKDGILHGTPQKQATALLFDDCFANFHLRAEVRVDDKTDAGITFRLPHFYSAINSGWNEVQIAIKHDYFLTGGVYPSPQVSNRTRTPLLHKPGEWFTLELIVQDKHVVTKVNGTVAADIMMKHDNHSHFHPLGHVGLLLKRVPPPPVRGRRAGDEPIDPTAKVEFRKLEIMPLAD